MSEQELNLQELDKAIQSKETETELSNPISEMIDNIMSGTLSESNALFYDLVQYKIAEKIEEKKISVAKSLFGESEDEEKDEKHAETSDDDFSKSLHGQLKTAEDIDANPVKPEEQENPNDKRVQAGLAARAAKGEMAKPNAHRDIKLQSGSVTLQDGDAKRINSFLGGLKPTKRKEVMDHMHKSPEHFNKVHDVIKKFPTPTENKSLYSDERAG